jgi:ferredoxin
MDHSFPVIQVMDTGDFNWYIFCKLSVIYIYNLGGSIMAYRINEECIACGACQPECPVEAISEGDIFIIDEDKCIDCGACADICPVGSPNPVD